RVNRTTWSLPSTAAETLPTRRVKVSANQAAWSGVTGACCAVVGALMNSFRSKSSVPCTGARIGLASATHGPFDGGLALAAHTELPGRFVRTRVGNTCRVVAGEAIATI